MLKERVQRMWGYNTDRTSTWCQNIKNIYRENRLLGLEGEEQKTNPAFLPRGKSQKSFTAYKIFYCS